MTGVLRRRVGREAVVAEMIPYAEHVAPFLLRTRLRDYVQIFRLAGIGFETADDAQLNAWHERLNYLWRNLADPHLAIWMHVLRRRAILSSGSPAGTGFACQLRQRYEMRLSGQRLMTNELYLSVVYRPASMIASHSLAGFLGTRDRDPGPSQNSAGAIELCARLGDLLQTSLARYMPERLGLYTHEGRVCSSALEFLSQLINGDLRRVPLPRGPLHQALASSRPLFGREVLEIRLPEQTRRGAMLGIKEYPPSTPVGAFDRLLSAPFSFVLTQSFAFLSRPASQGILQRQIHRLANAGDFALSQIQQLHEALDGLTAGDFFMGQHHFSLQVSVDSAWQGEERPDPGMRQLHEALGMARTLLGDMGMTVAREDLALEAAFWAQLPGNMSLRPRTAPISSRNFAALTALHAYPAGRREGNHWGAALTTFVTSAQSPFHFSLHASDPREGETASRHDTGHTFICGPTGSGKTVLIGFLVAMLQQRDVTQCIFDKDHGLEILVRALGGTYLSLRSGESTGCNPLQLPMSPAHNEFLRAWLRALVRSQGPGTLSMQQQHDLENALRGTLSLPMELRRLSRLVEFLDRSDPEGVHARLSPWCEATGGTYAWVFDNAEDQVLAQTRTASTMGFDVTHFIENDVVRGPLSLYLFHLVRQLLDGRRLVCWMDEFWRLLEDPAFETFAKDGPKTWRKLNGVMVLATQSASDVLRSPISRTIVEQTPTKIFFPNIEAMEDEYTRGFGLSHREFALIRQIDPASRRFLVRQGHHSVLCNLDLQGCVPELRVMASRRSDVDQMRTLMEQFGSRPQDWVRHFLAAEVPPGPRPGFPEVQP